MMKSDKVIEAGNKQGKGSTSEEKEKLQRIKSQMQQYLSEEENSFAQEVQQSFEKNEDTKLSNNLYPK